MTTRCSPSGGTAPIWLCRLLVAGFALLTATATAQSTLSVERLAKAQPDECFVAVGEPYPPPDPNCPAGSIARVNSSYVWSMTRAADRIWFGTVSNIFCQSRATNFGELEPFQTPGVVCEFGQAQQALANPDFPPELGDWRPPSIYSYDLSAPPQDALVERTANLPLIDQIRLNTTVGFRSAGTLNNVVLLGGPTLFGRVNIFAFRADTGAFISSRTLEPFDNIRQWTVLNNALYVGVSRRGAGGHVLRWTGNVNNPHQFAVVGNIDAFPASMTSHEGRLYLTTWPRIVGERNPTGVWMSPVAPPAGLNALHANRWRNVWSFDEYEPDPVTANTYGGGAIASYAGWVYWGSMHIPEGARNAWTIAYGPPATPEEAEAVNDGTLRALTIYRGRMNGDAFEAELLYGESELPAFDPVNRVFIQTPTGMQPRFGPSGFGNDLNNYTWSMAVFQDRLFVGTLDQSYVTYDMAELIGVSRPLLWLLLSPYFGGDLWRFDDAEAPALAEHLNGLNNYTNWGIRTLLSTPDALYAGTANPMNLLTSTADNIPEGGWELLRLTPIAPRP